MAKANLLQFVKGARPEPHEPPPVYRRARVVMSEAPSSSDGLTPAQRMAAQAAVQAAAPETHQPSIEDAVDEEDLKHPTSELIAPTNGNSSVQSAKAAGKQRANDTGKKHALNTASEEAFPSLAAPKPAAAAASSTWGARPAIHSNGPPTPSAMPTAGAKASTRPTDMPGRAQSSMSIDTRLVAKRKNSSHNTLQELLKHLQTRLGVRVQMTNAAGKTIFKASGPTNDAVNRALKDIAGQWTADQSVNVPVPASLLPQIIGKQGSKIKEIQERTGAKLQADRNRSGADDEDVNILIQGNPVTAEAARREIMSIVNERTSTVNLRMSDIPPELFPFIAGPHRSRIATFEDGRDVRVRVPHYQNWQSQPPAQPAQFAPQDGYSIQIQGEREAARQVQAEIQQQVAALVQQLSVSDLDVEREKHKFVLGSDERELHNFLQETGCSLILPPPGSNDEKIYIVGPRENIQQAVDKAMDNALSMSTTSIDVARQHPNADRGHAQDIARYLRQREAIRELERLHDSNVVLGDGPWQIYSRDGKKGMKARSDITNLIGAHPPARFRRLQLHPYYQQHVLNQHAQAVRDQYGVHLVVSEPHETESPLLLVYEGPQSTAQSHEFSRSKPSAQEVAEFEKALVETEAFLLGLLGVQDEIVHSTLDAPARYREKLQRQAEQESLKSRNALPVQFLGFSQSNGQARGQGQGTIPLTFRGPASEVDAYRQNLLNFIEEQIKDEAERDYTVTCDFPQKHANQLIGRKGENINRLRLEHDVEIQVQDGKVEIKGPQRKAHAARAEILKFGQRAEDETTHVLKVKPQFHGSLIGPGGKNIKRLQDRYGVHINFPHAESDNQIVAEGESGTKSRRPVQAPDEITIRGPSKGANEARKEIVDAYEYMVKNSHSATVSVSQSQLPSLIGTGGKELDNLRLETNAAIDVPGSKDVQDPSGRVEIKLRGTKEAVDKAKKIIADRAKVFDDSILKTVNVDKKHHRALIGRNGDNLLELVVAAGGDPEERNRLVRFPNVDSPETGIRINGRRDVVEKLAAAMEAFALQRDLQVTDTVDVAPERHGALIGSGGAVRKEIESKFGVTMNIPDRNVTGPARSAVKLSGLPENVQKAKAHIADMTKGPESEIVQVPIGLHHVLFDAHNRRLQGMKVRLDHAGQPRPARAKAATARTGGAPAASMPLITDDAAGNAMPDVRSQHRWDIQGPVPTGDGAETIPWVLKAQEAARVAEARQLLLDALLREQQASTGYLVLPDPSMNQFVIGPGGATINNIRDETGCSIDVPKRGGSSEVITIRGPHAGVEQAKDMIIDAVSRGRQRQ